MSRNAIRYALAWITVFIFVISVIFLVYFDETVKLLDIAPIAFMRILGALIGGLVWLYLLTIWLLKSIDRKARIWWSIGIIFVPIIVVPYLLSSKSIWRPE